MAKKLREIIKKVAHSKGDEKFASDHTSGRNSVKYKNDKPTENDAQFHSDVPMFDRHREHGYNPGEDDARYDSVNEVTLVHKSGKELKVGDKVKDFRGDEHEIAGWSGERMKHNPSSTGRVTLKRNGKEREFFPSVIDAELKEAAGGKYKGHTIKAEGGRYHAYTPGGVKMTNNGYLSKAKAKEHINRHIGQGELARDYAKKINEGKTMDDLTDIQWAKIHGHKAGKEGRPSHNNPYNKGTKEREVWSKSHEAASKGGEHKLNESEIDESQDIDKIKGMISKTAHKAKSDTVLKPYLKSLRRELNWRKNTQRVNNSKGKMHEETLDEVSKEKLTAYKDAAYKDIPNQFNRSTEPNDKFQRKISKRLWGTAHASMRLKGVSPSSIKKLKEEDLVEGLSTDAGELKLYADNTSHLYHSSHVPIVKNLEKKHAKGKYDHEKAKKLWGYHADRAAQAYHKEFGSKDTPWHKMFPTHVRKEAASAWADEHHPAHKEETVVEGDVIHANFPKKDSPKPSDGSMVLSMKTALEKKKKLRLKALGKLSEAKVKMASGKTLDSKWYSHDYKHKTKNRYSTDQVKAMDAIYRTWKNKKDDEGKGAADHELVHKMVGPSTMGHAGGWKYRQNEETLHEISRDRLSGYNNIAIDDMHKSLKKRKEAIAAGDTATADKMAHRANKRFAGAKLARLKHELKKPRKASSPKVLATGKRSWEYVSEEALDELNKSTLSSYIKKRVNDISGGVNKSNAQMKDGIRQAATRLGGTYSTWAKHSKDAYTDGKMKHRPYSLKEGKSPDWDAIKARVAKEQEKAVAHRKGKAEADANYKAANGGRSFRNDVDALAGDSPSAGKTFNKFSRLRRQRNLSEAKKKLTGADARDILASHGGNADFHTLRSDVVDSLVQKAKEYGYRKSKSASGSTGRSFHSHLNKKARLDESDLDHTKNKFHKVLEKHGFKHTASNVNDKSIAPHTQHLYHHESGDHVAVHHYHGSKDQNWHHRYKQPNGIWAPSAGDTKPQLDKTLAGHYGPKEKRFWYVKNDRP